MKEVYIIKTSESLYIQQNWKLKFKTICDMWYGTTSSVGYAMQLDSYDAAKAVISCGSLDSLGNYFEIVKYYTKNKPCFVCHDSKEYYLSDSRESCEKAGCTVISCFADYDRYHTRVECSFCAGEE